MRHARGFTLIEIMVVIVIIGILAGIVTAKVIDRLADARIQAARFDIRTIEAAFSMYKMDNFSYPSTELGTRALVERPPATDATNWRAGGYLKKLPADPWGNDYLYTNNGREIDIYTLGADARPGGEDEAADIHWADL